MGKLDYLEDERKKLWKKVTELEENLSKRSPDYEKEARQSSKKASEYRNRSNEAKEEANKNLAESKSYLIEIKKVKTRLINLGTEVEKLHENSTSNSDEINTTLDHLTTRKDVLEQQIEQIEQTYINHDTLVAKISGLDQIATQADDLKSKIDILHKSAIVKKQEINNLHNEIFGYEVEGEEGEEDKQVEGLKDKLDQTYKKLERKFNELGEGLIELEKGTTDNYDQFITGWDTKLGKLKEDIEKLLPSALTAGLSSAYSEKKEIEENESAKLIVRFNWGIFGMVLVSLIPFGVSVWLLFGGKDLVDILLDMPRLVFSILPLYAPVLWLTYSANKKLNLSKRLIEEYTHKEVLSKTFEGLSKQIDDLGDYDNSFELRVKLLYNILEISSENPGKLISDYKNSDHPLMDALDKSSKLASAVDRLSGIPGLNRLLTILDRRSKQILSEEANKISSVLADGLADQDDSEVT